MAAQWEPVAENQVSLDDATISEIRKRVRFLHSKTGITSRRREGSDELQQIILVHLIEGIRDGTLKFPTKAALFAYLNKRTEGECKDVARRAARNKHVPYASHEFDDPPESYERNGHSVCDLIDGDWLKSVARKIAPTVCLVVFESKTFDDISKVRQVSVRTVRRQYEEEIDQLRVFAHRAEIAG